ncbi:MAG: MBL fold metallo-hydrolase [Patescibacteria group bacterium]|nr:MBL fold metallo-hydrolase [Patescibacteria group bacterium]
MNENLGDIVLKIFPTGDLETNAYLVFNIKTKEAFLVDCPAPINEYRDFIINNNLNLKFLLLTHGHYDHIDGVGDFLKEFKIPFYVQKEDLQMLVNPLNNGSLVFRSPGISIRQKPAFYKEGDRLSFGEHEIQIFETPGHTPGSVSIKFMNWLFSGDLIFYHSVGRTDFPFSNQEHLIKSIKEKVFNLDPKTIIYPGHGRQTSAEEEIANNPFIR